jgi:hypothetical protein
MVAFLLPLLQHEVESGPLRFKRRFRLAPEYFADLSIVFRVSHVSSTGLPAGTASLRICLEPKGAQVPVGRMSVNIQLTF